MDLVRQEKLDMAIVDSTNRDRSLHFRKLGQSNFCVALPADHPLAGYSELTPQQISQLPQIAFRYDLDNSFEQWASGITAEENIVCSVNTAHAALDLVASGVGIATVSESCVQQRSDICFIPLKNGHRALYMCILYDKWLEPPVWNFVEKLVQVVRKTELLK
jgi:DNA-binding transcriptional LysR family regulator